MLCVQVKPLDPAKLIPALMRYVSEEDSKKAAAAAISASSSIDAKLNRQKTMKPDSKVRVVFVGL